jgi:hypothetical protein
LPHDISDISYPTTVTVDPDCMATLGGAAQGTTICAIMSIPDGVMYLVPYAPFTGGVRVAGQTIPPIVHQAGGIAGHEQLAIFLKDRAGISPQQGYVGFSVLYDWVKGGFGSTSRSQNNQHFRNWLGGHDRAFESYHAANTLNGAQVSSAPQFFDVTGPGSGELPDQWSQQMKAFLVQALGARWVNCILSAPAPVDTSSAPPAPPMPPKK